MSAVPPPPVSRNAPCPCGSGRRYKECHGALEPAGPAPLLPLATVMAAALAAQTAGRYDEAGRLYTEALAREPENFDALHMLGVVHYQRHDYVRAEALLRQAAALRPDVAAAGRNLRLAEGAVRRLGAAAAYQAWLEAVERPRVAARAALHERAAAVANAPAFSVLLPTFNSPERWLRACLDSVFAQSYPHWELCIADDASPQAHVRAILCEYAARDPRVRAVVRPGNGHIAAASNTALGLARREFVALLDHDDVLPAHALAEAALAIAARPGATIVYSDEDKIDEQGRRFEPYFKPDWNPALLTAQNYVSHLGVYRTELVRAVGGFRPGYEGAQDWDLLLRCAERVDAATIVHVPHILYHWRSIEGSTARTMASKEYAAAAQERTVADAFARRGVPVRIRRVLWDTFLQADPVPAVVPSVSLVLLCAGQPDEVDAAVARWREATAGTVGEVLAACIGSGAATAGSDAGGLRLGPGGAAAINAAAGQATGEVLLFAGAQLAFQPDALATLVAHAQQADAGPVGALHVDPFGDIVGGGWVLDPEAIAGAPWAGDPQDAWGMAGRTALVQNLSAVRLDAMAVRRSLWRALGGLDADGLAARFHDVDFGLRAARAGCRPVWHPGAVAVHPGAVRVPEPGDVRGNDADARTMRARWGAVLAADPAYHPDLARVPRLFELPPPPN